VVGAGTEKFPFGGVESPDVSPDRVGFKEYGKIMVFVCENRQLLS